MEESLQAEQTTQVSSQPPPQPIEHLSFPTFTEEEPQHESTAGPSRQILKDRLYIGNLHPSVDEYTLLQVFSKFGKVTKLDFLFHKTGMLKGKPRGYAFVEYGKPEEAVKALSLAHDKLLRGRKLVVTYAQQAPLDSVGSGGYGQLGSKHRKGMSEAGRPTTLSLLKSGSSRRESNTQDKIAMMEAKLRQMESTNPGNRSSSTILPHPSLPPKPIGAPTTSAPHQRANLPARPAPATSSRLGTTNKPPPKKLPTPPTALLPQQPATAPSTVAQPLSSSAKVAKSKLVGVKITKPKQPKPAETDD